MFRFQLPVGAAFAPKAVLRRTIGPDSDHRQRARRIEVQQIIGAYAFVLQHLQQAAAEIVGRQAGQQPGLYTQAAQAHGHVEGRPAGNRLEIHCRSQPARVVFTEEVEQRFATHQIHS
ncbi:hypothetical protein D3C85_1546790 [compost metagenome]